MDTNVTRWHRIQDLFHRASELEQGERCGYLADACHDDPGLQQEVESLLTSLTDAHGLIGAVRDESALLFDLPVGPQEGERVGPYRILRQIGRGGMGAVYAAVRCDGEYEQQVAIKLVRPEIAGAEVLVRFRNERQILATLDHPNIARLLDGGITNSGSPYLVMELVDGVPIDEYCSANGLGLRERLNLFRTVCSAVQHAHRGLLVHRDIKPSNILVTREGVPKLLDFGIAKILDSSGADENVTKLDQRPMTLDYASPEQVRGELTTTATDIFALGNLLYELLTGHRPYDTRSTHPVEAQRRICETEPVRPSVHNRQLSRELDDIVGMAIRKEPKDRYSSVEKFSADIQNYLDGFPISATKGTTRYRAVKFIGRHRTGVTMAVLAVLVLTGFSIGMGILAVSYARERDLERDERTRAEQVSKFVTGLFQASDPFQAKGKTITARQLLDAGAQRLSHDLQTQPAVRAKVLEVIAVAYDHLGVFDRAEAMYLDEIKDTQRAYGRDSLASARVLRELGDVERESSNLPAAEANLRRSMAAFEAAHAADSAEMSHVLNNLGLILQDKGSATEAEQLFERAVKLSTLHSKDVTETLVMKSNLGSALADIARYDDAERVLRGVLAERRRILGEHPQVFRSMQRLARLLLLKGLYAEAESLDREALGKFRQMLGPQHLDVYVTTNNLASVLLETGRLKEAEPLYREDLATGPRVLGEQHADVTVWQANLGTVLTLEGRWDEARELFSKSLAISRNGTGASWKFTPMVLSRYGRFLMAQGRLDQAEALFNEELATRLQRLGVDNPLTADAQFDVAGLRAHQGRYDEAAGLYKDALATDRKLLPKFHLQTAAHLLGLASCLNASGHEAEAAPLAREAVAIRKAQNPPAAWLIAEANGDLGAILVSLHAGAEGQALIEQSYPALRDVLGPAAPATRLARSRLH